MVEILCPHCEEEIELDDDASGEFACPYCDGEFEWGIEDDLDSFMDEVDTGIIVNQPIQQNIQIQANGETNTIAIVAIVFAGLALMGALGGAWVPLFGLCNLLFVIPAVILASYEPFEDSTFGGTQRRRIGKGRLDHFSCFPRSNSFTTIILACIHLCVC